MLADGVVKSVAAKLVSDNKEVVQNALKTIVLFSDHSPPICANQVCADYSLLFFSFQFLSSLTVICKDSFKVKYCFEVLKQFDKKQ